MQNPLLFVTQTLTRVNIIALCYRKLMHFELRGK
jgi:hypothetical protein